MGKKDELRGLKENVIVGRLDTGGDVALAYHNAQEAEGGRNTEFVLPESTPAEVPAAEISADAA